MNVLVKYYHDQQFHTCLRHSSGIIHRSWWIEMSRWEVSWGHVPHFQIEKQSWPIKKKYRKTYGCFLSVIAITNVWYTNNILYYYLFKYCFFINCSRLQLQFLTLYLNHIHTSHTSSIYPLLPIHLTLSFLLFLVLI